MKMHVHNLLEANTLIKEMEDRGEFDKLDGLDFYTHQGEYLLGTKIQNNQLFKVKDTKKLYASQEKQS